MAAQASSTEHTSDSAAFSATVHMTWSDVIVICTFLRSVPGSTCPLALHNPLFFLGALSSRPSPPSPVSPWQFLDLPSSHPPVLEGESTGPSWVPIQSVIFQQGAGISQGGGPGVLPCSATRFARVQARLVPRVVSPLETTC